MPDAAATELPKLGIDVLLAKTVTPPRTPDLTQLSFAAKERRVLCTQDKHFLEIARKHPNHWGIAFVKSKSSEIGSVVKALRELHQNESPDSMRNMLTYL